MAFQAVPDVAECVIEYLGNGVTQKNVVHAKHAGGYDLIKLAALAVLVDQAVGNNWLIIQSQDVNYVKTTVRGLAVENDLEVENNASAAPGTVVTNVMPGNVTFSIKKTSGFTGRSARGRLYWIGLGASQLSGDENVLLAASAAAAVAAVESLRVNISAGTWIPVIVSRFTNGLPRATGITFGWTSTTKVDDRVDTMRRRLTV